MNQQKESGQQQIVLEMECNRDEAIRAKELSEKKFTEKDIAGAKKWALKAQNLHPDLDGLSQLIATFDVYISAQEKKNGVVDWYRVLGVEPSANDETIKKHYRTLALFLHPDKNRSVGAEGAFALLSEGWRLLADKAKRIAYDQKRNLKGIHLNIQNKGSTSSMPSYQSGSHDPSSKISPNTMRQKNCSPLKSSVPPHPLPRSNTFWTTCYSCKMQFEYFRTFLRVNLLCPNCHQPFVAVETPAPPIKANDSSIKWNSFMRRQNSHQNTSENPSINEMPPPRSSIVNLSNAFTKSSIDGNSSKKVLSTAQGPGIANPEFGQSKRSGRVRTSDMREGAPQMEAYHSSEKPGSGISIGSVGGDKPKKPGYGLSMGLFEGDRPNRPSYGLSVGSVGGDKCNKPAYGLSMGLVEGDKPNKPSYGLSIGSVGGDKPNKPAYGLSMGLVEGDKPSKQSYGLSIGSVGGDKPNKPGYGLSVGLVEGDKPSKPSYGLSIGSVGGDKPNKPGYGLFMGPVEGDKPNKVSYGLSIGSVGGDKPKKKRCLDECRKNSVAAGMANLVGPRVGLPGSKKGVHEAGKQSSLNLRKEMPQLEIRDMLMTKAKQTILKKLGELKLAAVTSDKEVKKNRKQETESKGMVGEKTGVNKCVEPVQNNPANETSESPFARSDVDPSAEKSDMLTMNVPDPDFHDFDNDRTENSFEKNQVWATYDDDDGMPRYYAMIDEVVSQKPFRIRIRWLRSKSNNELAPINWISFGFCKSIGEFRLGKYEDNKPLNSFSHKVNWAKGTKGVIKIYPKEGDVWALYRNWSYDWNELTPDEVIQKYDMVEVLNDYNEENGITVVPLMKVAGFKTVFRRHPDPSKTKTFPREEMFRFSHQVPSYLLSGQEGHNAPRGCLELDPAAMPLELLQVLTETQLREMEAATEMTNVDIVMEDVGKAEEDKLARTAKTTDEAIIEVTGKEEGGKSKKVKLGKTGETTNEEATIAESAEKAVVSESMAKGKETEESNVIVYRRKLKKQKL